MKKVVLKEIDIEPRDIKYEIIRAIKTFVIILVLFLLYFSLKQNYNAMLEKGRNMRFYPVSTVFYIDGIKTQNYIPDFEFSEDVNIASYGIFKDSFNNNKFLLVAYTPEKENTLAIKKESYYLATIKGYTFITDSEYELEKIRERIKLKNYEFLKNRNLKKLVKKLDNDRTKTIFISDVTYTDIGLHTDVNKIINKIFDKAIIQTFEKDGNIEFIGELTFKNKIANAALLIKEWREKFSDKTIKLNYFGKDKLALVVGIKDFDLLTNTLVKILKSRPNNQYNKTITFMQSFFDFNIEEDIVTQLGGSAVFYAYEDEMALHPVILVETKKDIAVQGKKYLNFLQIEDKAKIFEKQYYGKTYNVLRTEYYPYNLSFGSFNEKLFVLGHQNIIEKYLNSEYQQSLESDSDIYFYSDIQKVYNFSKNNRKRNFWSDYKSVEIKFDLSSTPNFQGKLVK